MPKVKTWKQDPTVDEVGIRTMFIPSEIHPGDSAHPIKGHTVALNRSTGNFEKGRAVTYDRVIEDQQIVVAMEGLDAIQPRNGDFLFDQNSQPKEFDAVHTFAVVRRVIDMYQRALTRVEGDVYKVRWLFDGQLQVFPYAGEGPNAFYSREERCLKFLTMPANANRGPVLTARSFDVVAHETGHAVLDAIKPGYFTVASMIPALVGDSETGAAIAGWKDNHANGRDARSVLITYGPMYSDDLTAYCDEHPDGKRIDVNNAFAKLFLQNQGGPRIWNELWKAIDRNKVTSRDLQTGALHEAFGDITCILLMIAQMDVCEAIIADTKGDLLSDSFFTQLAEQFGTALNQQDGALRHANNTLTMDSRDIAEVHDLSNVFTGAFYRTIAEVYRSTFDPDRFDPPETLFRAGKRMSNIFLAALRQTAPELVSFSEVASKMLELVGAQKAWSEKEKGIWSKALLTQFRAKGIAVVSSAGTVPLMLSSMFAAGGVAAAAPAAGGAKAKPEPVAIENTAIGDVHYRRVDDSSLAERLAAVKVAMDTAEKVKEEEEAGASAMVS